MTISLLSIPFTITVMVILAITVLMHYVLATKKLQPVDLTSGLTEPALRLSEKLASALPDSVILPRDYVVFTQLMKAYWAQQECEAVPACIVRPCDLQQLCTAITILKLEYSNRKMQVKEATEYQRQKNAEGIFAIRSGGHSPVSGAASLKGGVVIDLSFFREVTPAADGSSVTIGAGAKWRNVSEVLDEKGLAVIGGRNSAVGVGGLALGGGLSFFSPRFGLVSSNILSYEVVLASGLVTTASATTNADLWRALKGGSNNFGVVTRFTVRSFPSTKVWSGFLYMTAGQAPKVLAAFHDFLNRAKTIIPDTRYDSHAAGPLACFTYLQDLGIEAVSVNIVYTKVPEIEKQWPECWRSSGFKSLWHLWSSCKVRPLTSATDELNSLNPSGRRQTWATTTIKNDPATIAAAHATYHDAISSIRRAKVKGMSWTLVLQPLLPVWARKGDPNPLGLNEGTDEPLVIVSFTVNWIKSDDDGFAQTTTRRAIEEIDAFAAANDTGHRFRYLNYCGEWQKPFDGYGEENLQFLQRTSRKYDPEGLFQKGCVGGFKLRILD